MPRFIVGELLMKVAPICTQFAAYRLQNQQGGPSAPIASVASHKTASNPSSPSRKVLAKSTTTAFNQPHSQGQTRHADPLSTKPAIAVVVPVGRPRPPDASFQSKTMTGPGHVSRGVAKGAGHQAAEGCNTARTSKDDDSKPRNNHAGTGAEAKRQPGPLDIGQYDGGLERPDAQSSAGEISQEAAELLALDSSASEIAPTRSWSLSSFELGRPLGKGKFGRVYMVRTLCEPRYIIALKCLHKHEIVQAKVEKQVRREIEIQSHLRYVRSLLS